MKLSELRDAYRQDTRDLKKPYLWSDEELDRYANAAVDEACRRAGLIVDSTSEAAQIDVDAGDAFVELHESVIYVRRAKLTSQSNTLVPRVARAMDEDVPGWEDANPAQPRVFVPDWETGKLRFWPPSKTADTLKMTVVRTPLTPMDDDNDVPPIASRYHLKLIDWMKFLGYSKQDADTYDPKKAALHADLFTAEFGPPIGAIDEHWAAEQYYDVGNR